MPPATRTDLLAREPELAALAGRVLGRRYRLVRLLGAGGCGGVFEAVRLADGAPVALKVLRPELARDEQIAARFAREARTAAGLESPHIVRAIEAATADGTAFYSMELLEGEDLGARLGREGMLDEAFVVAVARGALEGLAVAHAQGIIHRDLKPENIFLARSVNGPAVKLVDFGMARLEALESKTLPLRLTSRGVALGTPLYMSPEQAQALPDLDLRSDLYALGAILFECLTGRLPHVGANATEVMLAICTSDAPDVRTLRPSVTATTADLLRRALARDRAARFPSAEAMLDALPSHPRLPALADLADRALPPSGPRGIEVGWKLVGLAALALLLGCALTLGVLWFTLAR